MPLFPTTMCFPPLPCAFLLGLFFNKYTIVHCGDFYSANKIFLKFLGLPRLISMERKPITIALFLFVMQKNILVQKDKLSSLKIRKIFVRYEKWEGFKSSNFYQYIFMLLVDGITHLRIYPESELIHFFLNVFMLWFTKKQKKDLAAHRTQQYSSSNIVPTIY